MSRQNVVYLKDELDRQNVVIYLEGELDDVVCDHKLRSNKNWRRSLVR